VARRLSGTEWRARVSAVPPGPPGPPGPTAATDDTDDTGGSDVEDALGLPGLWADVAPLAELAVALLGRPDADPTTATTSGGPAPTVVGMAGGVASGKSAVAAALAAGLRRHHHLDATVVSTDGFLFPNAELERRGLSARKGFPESYDLERLDAVLGALRAGDRRVEVPVYDHVLYDLRPDRPQVVGHEDLLVIEGVNVLQPAVARQLHLGVYVDAAEDDLQRWYRRRVAGLRAEASRPGADPRSFYAGFAALDDEAFGQFADRVWAAINHPNLVDHIQPTRVRADLILEKASDHSVRAVELQSPRAESLVAGLAPGGSVSR
jgi:type I pantothenate kinase